MLADMNSMGINWHAIELESPLESPCTKKGDPSKTLRGALRQIQDWRAWLRYNLDYESREKDRGGLGLVGISGEIPATILIGRRKEYPAEYNEFRRQHKLQNNIEIHSFDWLVDAATHRLNLLRRL